jgi:hypothetical protein
MMNRGTGFIALTLAGHLPARVGLLPAVRSHQHEHVILFIHAMNRLT